MEQLIAGLFLFLGVHAIPMFQNVRSAMAARAGVIAYQFAFALVSIAGLVLLARGYSSAQFIALWEPPSWSHAATFLLMMLVFPLLIAAYLPGQLRKFVPHPMLMAVKIWAVAHLISNGDLASLLLFGSLLIYGVVALISIKRRQHAKGVMPKRGPLFNDAIAVVIGLALYMGMILWGHDALIGHALIG